MNLLGKSTPLQVLRGSIRSLNAISLDRSLSRDGFCADARAAGEGIAQAKKLAADHMEDKSNPHGVTKQQVGLGNADNTADLDKPVSTAQETAIAEAKQEALEAANTARKAADKAQGTANQALSAGEAAQRAADTAQAEAESARTAAEQAQAAADQKTAWFTGQVTLETGQWRNLRQTVKVFGVKEDTAQPIWVTPAEDSLDAYGEFGIQAVGQGEDALTFSCQEVPDVTVTVQILGFTVPKEDAQ